MTSGSSSSENTPLLNGSHEGPCYAYSYANSREEDEEEDRTDLSSPDSESSKEKIFSILRIIKITFFLLLVIFCVISLCFIKAENSGWNSITLTKGQLMKFNVSDIVRADDEVIHLRVKGPFLSREFAGTSAASFSLTEISPERVHEKVSDSWIVLLASDTKGEKSVLEHDFYLTGVEFSHNKTFQLTVTSSDMHTRMEIDVSVRSKIMVKKIIMAVCLLLAFHTFIIFELLPKTLAAMITAIVAISCTALVDQVPTIAEVVNWMDFEALSLVFGIVFLTSMLCDSGLFDCFAVLTYKTTGGHFWIIITTLFFLTTLTAAFLDSLVTVTIMTAVAIRLCEAMNIDPKHILMCITIYSNIGRMIGYSTYNHQRTTSLTFGSFVLHIFPVLLLCFLSAYAFWRLKYRDVSQLRFKEPLEVEEVKREQEVWKKAYHSISSYSREEESVKAILERKMSALETLLRKKLYDTKITLDDYKTNLKELTNTMKEKNKSFFYKTCSVTLIVLVCLLLRDVPHINLTPGWIAILGAICLLILGDFDKLGSVLNRVEWSSILFLASLFIITEVLKKLDLVKFMVMETQNYLTGQMANYSLLISLIFLIWLSAVSESLSIPFSTAMTQILRHSTENTNPLAFALTLGACLGANGSILGGTANILSATLAEQHGYSFSYCGFFKIGFPIMILTTAVSMAYLLICHIWLGWND